MQTAAQNTENRTATTAHTPGPWKLIKRGGGNGFDILWNDRLAPIYWPSGLEIARIVFKRLGRGGRFSGNAVDEANGRLIAAAPAVLMALEMAMPALEWCEKGDGVNVLQFARAAIAKATEA